MRQNISCQILIFLCIFCPGKMTTHAEPINSDIQRGLEIRLRHNIVHRREYTLYITFYIYQFSQFVIPEKYNLFRNEKTRESSIYIFNYSFQYFIDYSALSFVCKKAVLLSSRMVSSSASFKYITNLYTSENLL